MKKFFNLKSQLYSLFGVEYSYRFDNDVWRLYIVKFEYSCGPQNNDVWRFRCSNRPRQDLEQSKHFFNNFYKDL